MPFLGFSDIVNDRVLVEAMNKKRGTDEGKI
jgi:hypothetical protein